jgi:BASS family bile acid:Na+ symporter
MQGDIVSGLLLPLALALIMFPLGLNLTPADFLRIVRQPRALLVGIVCHFVLLPLVCFAMIEAVGMEGAFAAGFLLLAACPTGTTSNLLTHLARGDVALALSFTAVASVLTIFTLPLIVSWALARYLASGQEVPVPVGLLMGQVFFMLGVPVLLGMAVRHYRAGLALRIEPLLTRAATLLFFAIVALAVVRNWALLRDNFATLAPFAIALNLVMLGIGFAVAWAIRLSRRQSITLGIETAIQNATLALVIASSLLQIDAMAVPGALYGVLMYGGGLVFALLARRFVAA